MLNIFGIEVVEANAFEDEVVEYEYGTTYQRVDARALVNFGSTVTAGQTDIFWTWKYHKLSNVNAQQIRLVDNLSLKTSSNVVNWGLLQQFDYTPS